VVKRCTGETTFAAIVDELATTYSAPRERVLADVTALLRGLADKRLLEL
jgi:pyrroloquinoline quinone biosynthesis protein D